MFCNSIQRDDIFEQAFSREIGHRFHLDNSQYGHASRHSLSHIQSAYATARPIKFEECELIVIILKVKMYVHNIKHYMIKNRTEPVTMVKLTCCYSVLSKNKG